MTRRKLGIGLVAFATSLGLPTAAYAGVVLSEISPCSTQAGGSGEWVEVRNDSTTSAAIGGWTIKDNGGSGLCFTIPAGTALAAGASQRFEWTTSCLNNTSADSANLYNGGTLVDGHAYSFSSCSTGTAAKRSVRAASSSGCSSGAWTDGLTGSANDSSNDSCGACAASTCTPNCSGKTCGDDGCGGSCGTCATGSACTSGACVASAPTCTVGAVCRAAVGDCDAAEVYDASCACPADAKNSSSTVCRPSGGACDVAEYCNGSSNTCPADIKVAANTACRSSGGNCDATEVCNGVDAACPADTGGCAAGSTCTSGVCVCTPSCNGKTCGADGCGGLCGTCAAGQACGANGSCSGSAISTVGALETWTDGGGSLSCAMYQSDPACDTAGCDPTGGTKRALLDLINSAQSEIKAALYELDDVDITSALKSAVTRLGRGKVLIVSDIESISATSSSKDDLDDIAATDGGGAVNSATSNVQIGKTSGIMHDKFIVVDGKHVSFGSNNLKKTMADNMDLRFVAFNNTPLAATFITEFDELFCHCRGGVPGACTAGSLECSSANNKDLVVDVGHSIAGGNAEVYFGPNDGLNARVRGATTSVGSMAACPDNTCGCYLKGNGGAFDVCNQPFHYVSATACTSNSDCTTAGYYCDAAAGKCAKDSCKCDTCDETGSLIASATSYKGSHFAFTDNCLGKSIKALHARGGTVEMIQDALFWSNEYSEAKGLCAALNVPDGTTSCRGDTDRFCLKVENVNGKDHEKNFCVETPNGPYCHVGSANISAASEESNTEDSVIFVNNTKVRDAFTRHMDKFLYGQFDGVAECTGQSTANCGNCATPGVFNDGNHNGINDCTEAACTNPTTETSGQGEPTTGGTTVDTSGSTTTATTCVANYCGKRCSHNSCACTADSDCGTGNTCLAAVGGTTSDVTFSDQEAHDVLDLANHGAEGDLDQLTGVDYGSCVLTGDTVATTCTFCNGAVRDGVRRDCASGTMCSGALCGIVASRPHSSLGSLDGAAGVDATVLTNLKNEVASKWCGAATISTNKSCGCSAPLAYADANSKLWAPLIDPAVSSVNSVTSTNGKYTLNSKGRLDTRTLKTTTATSSVTFSYTTYCDSCQGNNCNAGFEVNYLCGNATGAPAEKPYLNNYTYFTTTTISGATKRFDFVAWETEPTYDKLTWRYGADGNNDKLLDTIHGAAVTGSGTGWPHQSGACGGLAEPNSIPGDTIQLALTTDTTMNGHCASATPCVQDDPNTSVNEDNCPNVLAGGKCDSNGFCKNVDKGCGSNTECASYTYNSVCRPNAGYRLYKDCFR